MRCPVPSPGPGLPGPLSAAGDASPGMGAPPAQAEPRAGDTGLRERAQIFSPRVPDYRNWGKRCPLRAAPEPPAGGRSRPGNRAPDNELGRDVGSGRWGGGGGETDPTSSPGPGPAAPSSRAPCRVVSAPHGPSHGGAAPGAPSAPRGAGTRPVEEVGCGGGWRPLTVVPVKFSSIDPVAPGLPQHRLGAGQGPALPDGRHCRCGGGGAGAAPASSASSFAVAGPPLPLPGRRRAALLPSDVTRGPRRHSFRCYNVTRKSHRALKVAPRF